MSARTSRLEEANEAKKQQNKDQLEINNDVVLPTTPSGQHDDKRTKRANSHRAERQRRQRQEQDASTPPKMNDDKTAKRAGNHRAERHRRQREEQEDEDSYYDDDDGDTMAAPGAVSIDGVGRTRALEEDSSPPSVALSPTLQQQAMDSDKKSDIHEEEMTPIVAELVVNDESHSNNQALREQIRKEVKQEILQNSNRDSGTTMASATAVQVEVVDQDDADNDPIQSPVAGSSGLVGLFMGLFVAMAIVATWIIEAGAILAFGMAAFFYQVLPSSFADNNDGGNHSVFFCGYYGIFVLPFVIADIMILSLGVLTVEIMAYTAWFWAMIFFGSTGEMPNKCHQHVRNKVFWQRWTIRHKLHASWKLTRIYSIEAWQEQGVEAWKATVSAEQTENGDKGGKVQSGHDV